ncbi:ParB/RepB/Spo0J family partition protein [Labrenzia sp. R5_0]|uniref:ParB/RepB/Spo0J family partition protein n=1 Tax=Labrenzia sp. R5_0 TaxID=2821108 RepID=UPI001ADC3AE1|nr:ParB/RepB/Spo0J family partition protein [Labrenzia sp. R5_0]MBO9462464.1 ParB/RepB/Spo0J family partition protein [Labrenzia sp. R5_0]
MKLQHIELKDLKISPLNVRKHGAKSGEDLIPSIKAVGLIQPLLVRPNCEGYEVIAGQRRLNALQEIAKDEAIEAVPCVIMDDGDDVKAIEASLAENIARLPMDVLDQFEAFHSLSKQGQSTSDIAQHFGVSERLVGQRLAIANLYEPIRNAFRREEIGKDTLQILTMATKRQQKEWYKLFTSEDGYAPQGHRLKSWLFGGEQIPVSNALFDIGDFKGNIVSDLFGEVRYFADPKIFWEQQGIAIAQKVQDYRDEGWNEVILLEVGERFLSWEYADTPMEEGGRVYIQLSADGEVTAFEGQLSRAEIKKRAQDGEEKTDAVRPELTKPMQNYLALHRHSAVRLELLGHQGIALRLTAAQIIAGSALWGGKAEEQRAASEAIAGSLEANKAESLFEAERQEVRTLLGFAESESPTLVPRKADWQYKPDLYDLFVRLLALGDEAVMRILAFVAAETLAADSAMVEALGLMLGVDMKQYWQPDETFFGLLRDKEAINAAVSECAGKDAAAANLAATAKAQKEVIRKSLAGERTDGKQDWHPRYMAFPMQAYTQRGGIAAMDQWNAVKSQFENAA